MTTPVRARYAGYRFPAEIISHAVWLYFRFPLGLRMVEELLAARGIHRQRHRQLVWVSRILGNGKGPIGTHAIPMRQISAQRRNLWLLEALCSAAVT